MAKEDRIRLGAVTIGQSPRDDMVPEIKEVLGASFQLLQEGALDGYSYEDVERKFAPEEGDEVLVSRMRDGREVVFAERYVPPLVQESIDRLSAKDVDGILLLCTGEFPEFDFSGILVEPRRVLNGLLVGLVRDATLAVIVPDKEQVDRVERWWSKKGVKVVVRAASPYREIDQLKRTACRLKDSPSQLILLECMGFTRKMQAMVKEISGKQVLLPRTMMAAIVKELFAPE